VRGSLQAEERSDFWKSVHRSAKLILHQMQWRPNLPGKVQWFRSLLQQHTPDSFINALPENAQACSVWRWFETELVHSFSGRQVLPWEAFSREDHSLHPLEILSSEERLKRFAVTKAVFFTYDKPSELTWAAKTAAFGTIWPGQEQAYASVYELRNLPLSISQEAMLRQQLSSDLYASIIEPARENPRL
jgi:hypothetical protein